MTDVTNRFETVPKLWGRITGPSIGILLLAIVLVFAFGLPIVNETSPTAQSLVNALQPPSLDTLLGYDHLGRSMSVRLAAARRTAQTRAQPRPRGGPFPDDSRHSHP